MSTKTREIELPPVSVDDLLRMIGEREAIAYQHRVLIARQVERISELESDNTEP